MDGKGNQGIDPSWSGGEDLDWEIQRFKDLHSLSLEAADRIISLAREGIGVRGSFSMVLSGGKTPKMLYGILARAYPEDLWAGTHLFWGDERCVPPEHGESNFGLAYRELISKVRIPEANVHRIEGELRPPERAARRYEEVLRMYLSERSRRDLILLGMGSDGHIASIFPGGPAIQERERWVMSVTAPPGAPVEERITLTLSFINTFRKALILISGRGKGDLLKSMLRNRARAKRVYPLAMVEPQEGATLLIDGSTVHF